MQIALIPNVNMNYLNENATITTKCINFLVIYYVDLAKDQDDKIRSKKYL